MTTELTFPGRVVGMNAKGGLLRMHWTKKKLLKRRFLWLVHEQTRAKHAGRVELKLIRYSAGVPMDYDNLVSTGKILIDAIVSAGVIIDDKEAIIAKREYTQQKCKIVDQRTVIIITDHEPPTTS